MLPFPTYLRLTVKDTSDSYCRDIARTGIPLLARLQCPMVGPMPNIMSAAMLLHLPSATTWIGVAYALRRQFDPTQ